MKRFTSFLFSLFFTTNLAFASGMAGTEFWIGFMENQTQPQISVVITCPATANGTLSVPLAGWSQNFTVAANSSVKISIPYTLVEALGNMSLENKGVHLVSDNLVFVSIYNGTNGSDDATSVLPVEALGYNYMAMTYLDPPNTNWGSPEILIVATEDNTQINITPSAGLSNGQTGVISVNLNKGQTYQVQSNWMNGGQNGGNDLSGSFIESVCNSDGLIHKIAVFSGDKCSMVGGLQCSGCDHLMEQMWPTSKLGTNFVVTAPVNRDTYILKIAAKNNNTGVNIPGQGPIFLNSGEWQQFTISGNKVITSTQPIAIGQFTKGQSCSTGLGDPFFSQIIPNNQMQSYWQFFSYESGSTINPYDSYVNIVAPAGGGTAPVFLDGVQIPTSSFQNVGNHRVAKVPISSNASTHNIVSSGGFNAYVYGYGPANSYNYNSGVFSNNTEADFNITYVQNTTQQAQFDDTICSCEPATFTSIFDVPDYTISWDFGDGQSGVGSPINHTYLNGSYEVTMHITAPSGCIVDSVVKLNLTVINCDINAPTEAICPNESVVLSSVNTAFSYLWSTGDTTASIVVSPQQTTVYWLQLDGGSTPICDSIIVQVHEIDDPILNDTTICETESLQLSIGAGFSNILWSNSETTPSIQVDQSGIYSVAATDSNLCVFYDTAQVIIEPVPQWTILGNNLICEGDSTLFQGPNFTANFVWNTGETTQDIMVSDAGVYEVSVDNGVCVSTNELELFVIDSMANYDLSDTSICAELFVLEIPNLPGTDFSWSTGDIDYTTTVFESGVYWIEIGNQCESWSDTMEVIFDCTHDLYVPNAFTPDGDQLNDVFLAIGYGIESFEMTIYNRWGEVVFQSEDLSNGWDGNYKGEIAQDGVYSYIISIVTVTNDIKQYKGHVSLIR